MAATQIGSSGLSNYVNTTSGKATGVTAVEPRPEPSAAATTTPTPPNGYVMVAQTGNFNRT